jgi:glycosyltransferase involved in cell wall biosynthesis
MRVHRLRDRLVAWCCLPLSLLLGPRRRRRRRGTVGRRITYVIWNAYATGGTVRTVLRQANALAERGRDVTVVSVIAHRNQASPFFELNPDVHLETLVDRHALDTTTTQRTRVLQRLDARPMLTTQFSMGRAQQASLLTDALLMGRLARTTGVVLGTRMGLNLAVARFAPRGTVRIAQEHLQLGRYSQRVQHAAVRYFPRLDLVASLTRYDADGYRRLFPQPPPRLAVVPNPIPDRLPPPADPAATRIVAVGRLSDVKAYDRLIEAFAMVADDFPDWDLRIIGAGGRRRSLLALAEQRELADRVALPGWSKDVDGELTAASVFGVSSIHESLPMAILEAMAAGLTVVSFACQTGPVELIDHGENGLLAPPEDVDALSSQLRVAMADVELRRRLGARAREDAAGFAVSRVTDRWLALFDDLPRARRGVGDAELYLRQRSST